MIARCIGERAHLTDGQLEQLIEDYVVQPYAVLVARKERLEAIAEQLLPEGLPAETRELLIQEYRDILERIVIEFQNTLLSLATFAGSDHEGEVECEP